MRAFDLQSDQMTFADLHQSAPVWWFQLQSRSSQPLTADQHSSRFSSRRRQGNNGQEVFDLTHSR